MTKSEAKPANAAVNELFAKSPDGLREIVRAARRKVHHIPLLEHIRALRRPL